MHVPAVVKLIELLLVKNTNDGGKRSRHDSILSKLLFYGLSQRDLE